MAKMFVGRAGMAMTGMQSDTTSSLKFSRTMGKGTAYLIAKLDAASMHKLRSVWMLWHES